jgi:predicted dinucleotide-binding enzyme
LAQKIWSGLNNFQPAPMMFVAGDDPDAKQVVLGLVGELQFQAMDAGPLTQARLLEPLALLWIDLAFKRGFGRDFAFSLIRKLDSKR